MALVSSSRFCRRQSEYIALLQDEPVETTSPEAGRIAVVVSPEFFGRAISALEDQEDPRAARTARNKPRVPFERVVDELRL